MNFTPLSDKAVIVIPAHNESAQIEKTLSDVKKYFKNVVVIDDGSSDSTFTRVTNSNTICIQHPINLGQGASLQTGISFGTKYFSTKEYFITFDADGQHSIESAIRMLNLIEEKKCDIVLGSRFIDSAEKKDIPNKKRFILKLAILFTKLDTGLNVTDTHNGLRVMNRKFAESLNIKQSGMAHASEILTFIRESNSNWLEAPAEIHYSDYAKRKGQSVLNAINILTELIFR